MRELKVRNPRTGDFDFTVEVSDLKHVQNTVKKLRDENTSWSNAPIEERCARLGVFANMLEKQRYDILSALSVDTGRKRLAELEIDGVISSLHAWVSIVPNLIENSWVQGKSITSIRHAPQYIAYPLVGVISPWNFPLTLSMIDTIPALLAGSSVVIKASEITPRFVQPLKKAIKSAGLDKVLCFIDGDGDTAKNIIDSVDAVCFTGSVETGSKVARQAAERMIPAFLELGGKDPMIVTASADIGLASDAALRASILATGQACQSIERIYVDAKIHRDFLSELVNKANKVAINWPSIDRGELGPIISEKQVSRLIDHIDDAVSLGAELLCGGEVEDHGGLWLKPTVLSNVNHNMKVMKDETFGPILPVMSYADIDEAVALANDSSFGLSAAVFSGSLQESEGVARRIEVGAVSINDASLTALFYEAEKNSFKLSGLGGSRMGKSGFMRFLRRKALIVNDAAPLKINAFSERPNS